MVRGNYRVTALETTFDEAFRAIYVDNSVPPGDHVRAHELAKWLLRPIVWNTQPITARWVEYPYVVEDEPGLTRGVIHIGSFVVELSQLSRYESRGTHLVLHTAQMLSIAPVVNKQLDPFSYDDAPKNGIPRISLASNRYALRDAAYTDLTFWYPELGGASIFLSDETVPELLDTAGRHLIDAAAADFTQRAQTGITYRF